jgi:hypothetical protein
MSPPQNPNTPSSTRSKPSEPTTTSPSSATSSCPTPPPRKASRRPRRTPTYTSLGRRPGSESAKEKYLAAAGRSGAAGATTKLPSSMPPAIRTPHHAKASRRPRRTNLVKPPNHLTQTFQTKRSCHSYPARKPIIAIDQKNKKTGPIAAADDDSPRAASRHPFRTSNVPEWNMSQPKYRFSMGGILPPNPSESNKLQAKTPPDFRDTLPLNYLNGIVYDPKTHLEGEGG